MNELGLSDGYITLVARSLLYPSLAVGRSTEDDNYRLWVALYQGPTLGWQWVYVYETPDPSVHFPFGYLVEPD